MWDDSKNYKICNIKKKKPLELLFLLLSPCLGLCIVGVFEIMTSELPLGEVRGFKLAKCGPTTLCLQKLVLFM